MQTTSPLFTNQLLMAHLHGKTPQIHLPQHLNQLNSQELQAYIQKELNNAEVYPHEVEQFIKTISSLNYSVETNLNGEQGMFHSNNLNQEDESFEIHNSYSNTQLLTELLAHEEETDKKDNNISTVYNSRLQSEEDMENNSQHIKKQELQEENISGYSEELTSLKDKIFYIESLAQQQIIRLKKQLEEERSMRGVFHHQKVEMVDAAINTEQDLRDQQIAMLKESLLHHITLNKKLMSQQLAKNRANILEGASINQQLEKIKL